MGKYKQRLRLPKGLKLFCKLESFAIVNFIYFAINVYMLCLVGGEMIVLAL